MIPNITSVYGKHRLCSQACSTYLTLCWAYAKVQTFNFAKAYIHINIKILFYLLHIIFIFTFSHYQYFLNINIVFLGFFILQFSINSFKISLNWRKLSHINIYFINFSYKIDSLQEERTSLSYIFQENYYYKIKL